MQILQHNHNNYEANCQGLKKPGSDEKASYSIIAIMKPTCPYCQKAERSVKAGFNPGGSQHYRCQTCQRYFTPKPDPQGYDMSLYHQALKLYLEGCVGYFSHPSSKLF